MRENMTVEVRVHMPWAREPYRAAIDICPFECEDSFAPLPRNREIPFEIREIKQAEKMVINRDKLAKEISKILTAKILQAVQSRDTHKGYSPEEWAAMNPNKERK